MVSDVLFLAGVALTIAGLYWCYPPAALVAFGVLLTVVGFLRHADPRSQGEPDGKAD